MLTTLMASGFTGGSQPFDTRQPSTTLNYCIAVQGLFPSRNLSTEPYLGAVELFAGSFAPRGWALAQGQLLAINQYQALFSILGTTYGGDGRTTFALPDLRGRVPIGAGQGPGLSNYQLGEKDGVENVTLTESNLAPHHHTLPGSSAVTVDAGGGQPFENRQPTLALTPVIALQGIFPSRNLSTDEVIASVSWFAGNFAPRGYAIADGSLQAISQNTPLFALLGTTYGGDGRTTFALPDLRGRIAIGFGQGPGLANIDLGQTGGAEKITPTLANLPAHTHAIGSSSTFSGGAGGSQPFDNYQPFLGMNYDISLFGIFPSQNLDAGDSPGNTDGGGSGSGFLDGDEVIDDALANQLIESLVERGIDLWSAAGISAAQKSRLASVHVQLADLDPGSLAAVSDDNVITIDRDASNRGWFVDTTPADNLEFGSTDPVSGELLATDTDSVSHYDLLTAIMHEQGHLLGIDHTDQPGDLMYGGLRVGGRKLPVAADVALSGGGPAVDDHLEGEFPLIASVGMFAGNFAPLNWAVTNGQLMSIAGNDALFSLIGTTYGGDGQSSFGLPDLRGRAVVGTGQGPGLTSNYVLGQVAGSPTKTLTIANLPAHEHMFLFNASPALSSNPPTATEDAPYSYNVTTQDAEGDPRSISATTLPAWLTLTDHGDGTAALSGTPTNDNVGANNVVLGVSDAFTLQNFDGVTTPALPWNWTTASSGVSGMNWVTTSTSSNTAPNSAFVADLSNVGDNLFTSPLLTLSPRALQIKFQNSFNTEANFDGGVLEISINGSAFSDIIAAGGSFVSGGYNATISPNFLNPLAGRQAWSGNSNGFSETAINLPAAAQGATVQFRWRLGSDSSVGGSGWWVDSVRLVDAPAPQSFSINVANVNDAPVLNTGVAVVIDAVAEDTTNPAGTLVSALVGGINDIDSGAVKGIAVSGVNNANGLWQYTLNGTTWLTFGGPTRSAARLLAADATTRIRFKPNTNFNGASNLYFFAWDQTSGIAGGTANLSTNGTTGGTTAFSTAVVQGSVSVTPVNDSPLLSTSVPVTLNSVAEDTTSPAGTLVSSLVAGVSDADAGAVKGVAVSGVSNSGGIWQYSLDGTTWLSFGGPTRAAVRLLAADATTRIRFKPNANFNGASAFFVFAWDQTSGSNGGTADISTAGSVGGTTAFSSAPVQGSATVTAVNDAPVLNTSVSVNLDPIAEDTSPAGTPVSSLVEGISDVDSGAVKGIAVSSVNNFTGTWQYTLNGTDWLDFGTAAKAAARLLPADGTARVRLLPSANYSGASSIWFFAWDQTQGSSGATADLSLAGSTGGATAFSKAAVQAFLSVTPVNDRPVLGGISGSVGYTLGSVAVVVAPAATVSDVDPDFSTGELLVHITDGASASNQLELSGFTIGPGNAVMQGATQIGTRTSDGLNGNDLRISLNTNATLSVVQQLLRGVTFRATGTTGDRTLVFTVSEGFGETSLEASKTVVVS